MTLIRTDGAVKQKIKVLYSGLQNQCNRCRGFGHYAKECKQPKSLSQTWHKSHQQDSKGETSEERKQSQYHLQQRRPKEPKTREITITAGGTQLQRPRMDRSAQAQALEVLQDTQVQRQSGSQTSEIFKGHGKTSQQVWRPRNPKEPDLPSQRVMNTNLGRAEEDSHQPQNANPQLGIEGQQGTPSLSYRDAMVVVQAGTKSSLHSLPKQSNLPKKSKD